MENTGVPEHDDGDTEITNATRYDPPEHPPEEITGVPEDPKNAGVPENNPIPPCREGLRSYQTRTYGHYVVREAVIPTFNRLKFNMKGEQVSVFKRQEPDPLEELVLHKTQQMVMNQGLKMFGGASTAAVHKEMQQLYDHRVSIPVDPDKRAALKMPDVSETEVWRFYQGPQMC